MTEKTKTNSKMLEEVNGGKASAYRILRQDVQAMIPDAVKEKLAKAKSDPEACRILEENGVNLEAIQKKIADAGFGRMNNGLQEISEEALESAAGGFFPINTGIDIVCTCGARKREDFAVQSFLALTGISNYMFIYRCLKCGQLIGLTRDGKVEYIDLTLPFGGKGV
ncbi:MAG: hypothetical protein IKE16_09375 [Solobacterium sp.]|nr:hypothetical protein [Solobacterium sp.]